MHSVGAVHAPRPELTGSRDAMSSIRAQTLTANSHLTAHSRARVEDCSTSSILFHPSPPPFFQLSPRPRAVVHDVCLLTAAIKWRVRDTGIQPMEVCLTQEAQVLETGIQGLSCRQGRKCAQRGSRASSTLRCVEAFIRYEPWFTNVPSISLRGNVSLMLGTLSRFTPVALERWWFAPSAGLLALDNPRPLLSKQQQ